MTSLYIAFAVGLTLGACIAIVAISAVAMGKLGDDPLPEQGGRDHYFAVIDLIEAQCKGADPAVRRALNRLHSKVLGMAQVHPASVREHVQD